MGENERGSGSAPSRTGSEYLSASRLQTAVLLGLVVQNTSVVLAMKYSREKRSGPLYAASTIVFLTELGKFLVSFAVMTYAEFSGSPLKALEFIHAEAIVPWKHSLRLAVPALIYVVQNNILYYAISLLSPAVFQIVYQLKIVFAAAIAVTVLHKTLGRRKWIAVALLFVGVVLVTLPRDVLEMNTSTADVVPTNANEELLLEKEKAAHATHQTNTLKGTLAASVGGTSDPGARPPAARAIQQLTRTPSQPC